MRTKDHNVDHMQVQWSSINHHINYHLNATINQDNFSSMLATLVVVAESHYQPILSDSLNEVALNVIYQI